MISSAFMMSTPDAINVESVRDQRAMATLRTTLPIDIGIRNLKRSHAWRPVSVFFHLKNPKIERPISGKMMNQ